MKPKLSPLYVEVPVGDRVMLPGAPTTGAEAEAARQLAERLEDLRLAAAILAGAAEKAENAIDATRYIRFVPLAAQRAWVRPLIAAREPLRRIIEACAALEDALAPELDEHRAGAPPVHLTIAAVEAARAALPDEKTLASIAVVSKTIVAVWPYAEALDRVAPAIAAMPSLPTAAPAAGDAPRPLTADELGERVGLGVSRAVVDRDPGDSVFEKPFSNL